MSGVHIDVPHPPTPMVIGPGADRGCPKCGSELEVLVRYVGNDNRCPTVSSPKHVGEHLHVTCARCGYEEAQPTLDAKP